MPSRQSRYRNATPFVAANGQAPMFRGLRPRPIGQAAAVLEHTILQDDRPDLLAQHYYVDSRKWWRLLDANPDVVFAADLTHRVDLSQARDLRELEEMKQREFLGATILIPRAVEPGTSR